MYLEEENQLLRENNIVLTLQLESMMNLQKENDQLQDMLNFQRQTKLYLKPAHVVNKGIQPNLLSIIINVGSGQLFLPLSATSFISSCLEP